MKWSRGHQSSNVVDRRGTRATGMGTKIGVGGGIAGLLLLLLSQVLGVDITGLGGSSSSGNSTSQGATGSSGLDPAKDPDRELYEFISFVFDDIQAKFRAASKEAGKPYQDAKLVVFTDAVDTQCGTSSAAIGPFYCPPDQMAYIDLSFYRVLRDKLEAGGDFAQAYVIAHELGHHMQTLQGIDVNVRRQAERDPSTQNDLSVRQELQADCFAGVWANSTSERGLLDRGDIEESVNAAKSIGDDRLQEMAGQQVNPETFTHGTSAQRVRWFKRGLDRGTLDACDTFTPTSP